MLNLCRADLVKIEKILIQTNYNIFFDVVKKNTFFLCGWYSRNDTKKERELQNIMS